jgi:uncharacterized iron-regulated membrane protein
VKLFRKVLFWGHLTSGVVAGVVILIMCVTGVALTYQKEMQYWADTRFYRTTGGGQRAAIADLIAAVRAVDPSATPATITWRSDPSAPVAAVMGPRTLYLNPYTAGVYGEPTGQKMRAFFTSMTNWHRYLAMSGDQRTTGRAITGASNLLFLFIVLSGLYLWLPKAFSKTQLRNILWFRRGLRPKARDFNWHNTIGIWSAIPLALVVYSGVVISYPWASNAVYRMVGEAPPAPAAGRAGGAGGPGAEGGRAGGAGRGGRGGRAGGPAGIEAAGPQARGGEARSGAALTVAPPPAAPVTSSNGNIEMLVDRAMAFQPTWQMLALRVPTEPNAPAVFTIDRGDAGQPNLRGTLTLDASTGEVQRWQTFSDGTRGQRLRSFLRFAHTGEIGGLTGQTIAGLVSAGGAVLVYTGIALALRRFWSWRSKRRQTDTAAAA